MKAYILVLGLNLVYHNMGRRRLQLANSSGGAINLTFYTEKVGEHDVCYGDFDELKNTLISIAKQYGEIYEHDDYVEYYVDYAPSFGVNISIDDEDIESLSAYKYENGYVKVCLVSITREVYVYSKCIYKATVYGSSSLNVLVSKLLDDGTQEIFAIDDYDDGAYGIYIWFATADHLEYTGSTITNPFSSGYKAITGLSETEDGEPSVSILKETTKNQYFITFDNQ